MSALSDLSPDQRAVLQLLLKQGKTYGELAALLRMDPLAVRERAATALDALAGPAGDGLGDADVDLLSDFVLGQAEERPPESPEAHTWSAAVAAALREGGLEPKAELSGPAAPPHEEPALPSGPPIPVRPPEPVEPHQPLPPLPAPPHVSDLGDEADAAQPPRDEAEPAAPHDAAEPAPPGLPSEPEPAAAAPGFATPSDEPRSSRIGGILLLLGIVAVVAVVLVVVLSGGGSDDGDQSASTVAAQTTPADTTSTAKTTPLQVEAQINMTPPGGGKALGVATIITDGQTQAVQIQTQGLAPNGTSDLYALWLTGGPGGKASLLGFQKARVGKSGRFQGTATLPADLAGYARIEVSRETKNNPSKPTDVVLRGALK